MRMRTAISDEHSIVTESIHVLYSQRVALALTLVLAPIASLSICPGFMSRVVVRRDGKGRPVPGLVTTALAS